MFPIDILILIISSSIVVVDSRNCLRADNVISVCSDDSTTGGNVYLSGVRRSDDTTQCSCSLSTGSPTNITINTVRIPLGCQYKFKFLYMTGSRDYSCTQTSITSINTDGGIQINLLSDTENKSGFYVCVQIKSASGSPLTLSCGKSRWSTTTSYKPTDVKTSTTDSTNLLSIPVCSNDSLTGDNLYLSGVRGGDNATRCSCSLSAETPTNITITEHREPHGCQYKFQFIYMTASWVYSCSQRSKTSINTGGGIQINLLSGTENNGGFAVCVRIRSAPGLNFTLSCGKSRMLTTSSKSTDAQTSDTESRNSYNCRSGDNVISVCSDDSTTGDIFYLSGVRRNDDTTQCSCSLSTETPTNITITTVRTPHGCQYKFQFLHMTGSWFYSCTQTSMTSINTDGSIQINLLSSTENKFGFAVCLEIKSEPGSSLTLSCGTSRWSTTTSSKPDIQTSTTESTTPPGDESNQLTSGNESNQPTSNRESNQPTTFGSESEQQTTPTSKNDNSMPAIIGGSVGGLVVIIVIIIIVICVIRKKNGDNIYDSPEAVEADAHPYQSVHR